MELLWVLFMVLMGAIPIALVILAVVMIPRRRKSENADSHVEWWIPPNH
jgi:phage shock protein PspC (stress-responsive transcriptional regulator)